MIWRTNAQFWWILLMTAFAWNNGAVRKCFLWLGKRILHRAFTLLIHIPFPTLLGIWVPWAFWKLLFLWLSKTLGLWTNAEHIVCSWAISSLHDTSSGSEASCMFCASSIFKLSKHFFWTLALIFRAFQGAEPCSSFSFTLRLFLRKSRSSRISIILELYLWSLASALEVGSWNIAEALSASWLTLDFLLDELSWALAGNTIWLRNSTNFALSPFFRNYAFAIVGFSALHIACSWVRGFHVDGRGRSDEQKESCIFHG